MTDRIFAFLLENRYQSHSIRDICKHVGIDKTTANRYLYHLKNIGIVKKTKESHPPSWQYCENSQITDTTNTQNVVPTVSENLQSIFRNVKTTSKIR